MYRHSYTGKINKYAVNGRHIMAKAILDKEQTLLTGLHPPAWCVLLHCLSALDQPLSHQLRHQLELNRFPSTSRVSLHRHTRLAGGSCRACMRTAISGNHYLHAAEPICVSTTVLHALPVMVASISDSREFDE